MIKSNIRSKKERERYTKAVMKTIAEPTIPENATGKTTDDSAKLEPAPKKKTRKSKSNRFRLHLKEHWPSYLIGFFSTIASIYILTLIPKITSIEKDIESINITNTINTQEVSNLIKKGYDDKIELIKDISELKTQIQSLNDRFELILNIKK